MLYYHRIDIFDGINVNKRSKARECNICDYWYFINKGFKLPPNACKGC